MDFKHLVGFLLTIIGIAVALLLLYFVITNSNITGPFFLALGICSVVCVFSGILILNKNK